MRLAAFHLLFYLLTVSCASGQIVESRNFSRDFQQTAINAVVRIRNITQGGAGTGYIIGRNDSVYDIVTAWHVVDGANKGAAFEVNFSPFTSGNASRKVTVKACEVANDCALLRVEHHGQHPVLKVCDPDTTPRGRFPVMAVGFPGGELTCHESKVLGTTDCKWSNYEIDGVFWRVQDRSRGGISGSPLLINQHEQPVVIGTWWGSSGYEGRCSHTSELRSFLHKSWRRRSPLPTPPQSKSTSPFHLALNSLRDLTAELDRLSLTSVNH